MHVNVRGAFPERQRGVAAGRGAAATERDLELIFDHLLESHASFGESLNEAVTHATQRILAVFFSRQAQWRRMLVRLLGEDRS